MAVQPVTVALYGTVRKSTAVVALGAFLLPLRYIYNRSVDQNDVILQHANGSDLCGGRSPTKSKHGMSV